MVVVLCCYRVDDVFLPNLSPLLYSLFLPVKHFLTMPCAANLEVDRGRVTLQPTMEIVSYPPDTSRFGCPGKNDALLV